MKFFKQPENIQCLSCGQMHPEKAPCPVLSRPELNEIKKEIEKPEDTPDFSHIEKVVVQDEAKNVFWQYKCRHCGSIVVSASVNILAFIEAFENQSKD